MQLLLIDYWREIAMALMIVMIAMLLSYYPQRVKVVEGERYQFETALNFQNSELLQQQLDYEVKLKELPKEITKIKTKYEVIYADIDTWKGDSNGSDCDNARTFLNSFNY